MSISWTNKLWHEPTVQRICTTADSVIQTLLNARTIDVYSDTPIPLYDVFTDMPKAVERIWRAIENKEVVYIFGDYDCDGITGTAQLARFFARHGIRPIVKLPHRMHDGYGLQKHSLAHIEEQKVDLVITVDTGITSTAEVAMLQSLGIDTIITDHHLPPAELPDAYALIHPLRSTVAETFAPSGSAVAHFLVRALEEDKNWQGRAYDELLMMIGLVGDIVPLTGINRSLTKLGLSAFHRCGNSPIHTLLTLMNRPTDTLTSSTVAFQLAPPINAAGRIADPVIALKGLLGDMEMLTLMAKLNTYRKDMTADHTTRIVTECSDAKWQEKGIICWLDDTLGHGIIGLIAGKITEHTGKPSIIATIENDICTASLRSPKSYNIMSGLHTCHDILLRYGGHAQAAGCSFSMEHWEEIQQRLHTHIHTTLDIATLYPTITIDAVVDRSIIHTDTIEQLACLEPFGQSNTEPVFMLRNVQLEHMRAVGSTQDHLQCSMYGHKAIGFGLGMFASKSGQAVDIACALQKSVWNNQETVEVHIKDIRSAI